MVEVVSQSVNLSVSQSVMETRPSGSQSLSIASRYSSSPLARSTLVVLLIATIPPLLVVVGVVPRCTELWLSIARVWGVCKGRPVPFISTSKAIGRSSVAVNYASGVAGSTTGHASVVEGLRLAAKAGTLLRRLLVGCIGEGLVWGVEGTNRLQLLRLHLRLLHGEL